MKPRKKLQKFTIQIRGNVLIKDQAELEKQKAADDVKQQIVAVSAMIASKLIAKSIDESESNAIIEQTLNEMGENTWRN